MSENSDLQNQIAKIQEQMSNPEFWNDRTKAQEKIDEYNQLKTLQENIASRPKYFSSNLDQKNAILMLSAGTGGTEACDWAQMLLKMYLKYAERKNFKTRIAEYSQAQEAGIKNATIEITGPYAYGYLKTEQGVHRLVRISPFDADKARHTSFALVEVIPEATDDIVEKIPGKDLKIEVFRSSGHGGQSVNTTDSAVRITHIPTNITASCQNERSQFQNKEMAMKILKAKLFSQMQVQKTKDVEKLKSGIVGAQWGSQIRSYVLQPYQMVKDHRTNYKESDAEKVLDGKIDNFIEKVLEKENRK
jgi:peptide chain release factor 2